jgi:hypothetical protein
VAFLSALGTGLTWGIRYNFAVVLEASGFLEDALTEYRAAHGMGVQRAEQNIRNVGAKILRQRVDALEEQQQATPSS